MMKKFLIITGFMVLGVAMTGCSKIRRNPGRVYMPDMAYSRAYETYASTEGLQKEGAHYTALPVPGTIARGDMFPYTVSNDSMGYYVTSHNVKNPYDSLKNLNIKEAERLYLINCGICHGTKLDGNGPLYNDGKGPYGPAPKNLVSDDVKKLTDGTIFHVMTYGKGNMGSYASQLNSMQRWMVVSYIRSKQGGGAPVDTTTKTTAPSQVVKDTTGTH